MTQGVALVVIIGLIAAGGVVYYFNGLDFEDFSGGEKGQAFLGELFSVFGGSNRKFIEEIPLDESRAGDTSFMRASKTVLPAKNCKFETSEAPARASVILNEIAWMGTAESSASEWIEFKNISAEALDLSGWQILNKNERLKAAFKLGAKIPAGRFLLAVSKENILPGVKADAVFSGAIKNSGEGLRLFNADCGLEDEVIVGSSWPAGDNTSKKTTERDSMTLAWYTSSLAGGTPGKENTAYLPPAQDKTEEAGQTPAKMSASGAEPALCDQNNLSSPSRIILINEAAWAGVSSDKTTKEWIELKNNTNKSIGLAGWQLLNKAASIKVFFGAGDVLAASGYFLLERTDDDTVPAVKADKIFTNAIKNSDESLRLFDNKCNLVDEIVAGPDWPAGSASPDYRTAERSPDFSWHTYSGNGVNGIFGTPKKENSSPLLVPVSQNTPASPASSPLLPPPSPPIYYTFQIFKSGNGSGSVTSNPAGINCGSNCNEDSEDFADGALVKLNATPSADSVFDGWSGACSDSGACLITMNESKNLTAIFSQVSSPPPARPPRLLVSEIMAGIEENANYEFIELYNNGDSELNLTGWLIKKRNSNNNESTLVVSSRLENKIILPGKYFLLTRDGGYTGSIVPDVLWPASSPYALAYISNAIIIFNETGSVVEEVSWSNIPAGQSFERESWLNNQFRLQISPNPQNSQN